MSESSESRRAERAPITSDCIIHNGETAYATTTINLSSSGALVRAPFKGKEGHEFILRLLIPGAAFAVKLTCRLVHCRTYSKKEFGWGVEFIDILPDVETLLWICVSKSIAMQHGDRKRARHASARRPERRIGSISKILQSLGLVRPPASTTKRPRARPIRS